MSIRYLTVALMASSVAFANLSYAQTAKGTDKMGGGGAVQLNPQPEPPGSTKRMGGGGGGKGAVQLNPQPEPPGRR